MRHRSVLLLLLTLAACHYVPPQMVALPSAPTAEAAGPQWAEASLAVAPVERPDPSAGELWSALNGAPLVSAPMFQEALVESLSNARLFATVIREPDPKYDLSSGPTTISTGYVLSAQIIEQREGGYSATVAVRYMLREASSGRVVWRDELSTSYGEAPSLGNILLPNHANNSALWEAFKENIETMIVKLGQVSRP